MTASRYLKGWFPVASKEFTATIFGPRLVIVACIMVLAVLGGSYAILPSPGISSGTPKIVTFGFVYYSDLNSSHPAIAVFVASVIGDHLPGIKAALENETFPQDQVGSSTNPVLATNTTDSSGWARFTQLWSAYPNSTMAIIFPDFKGSTFCCATTQKHSGITVLERGILQMQTLNLGGSSEKTLSIVFTDTVGVPMANADVYVWEPSNVREASGPVNALSPPGGWTDSYRVGATDASGYYLDSKPYGGGAFVVHVSKGGLNDTGFFFVNQSTILAGPDEDLALSGILFLPFILPITTLAIAYDAIAKERSEGSLDLLLSKPVSRVGVAIGKAIGVFGSMAVPSVLTILGASGLIWERTGLMPTGWFLAGFVGSALFLLLSYSLLFLAVSALSRSLGSALLVSVLSFLLFAFFWSLISIVLASIVAQEGSVQWFEVVLGISLFSPTGVYQQLLSQSISNVGIGTFLNPATTTTIELPKTWVDVATLGWVIAPLVAFLWAMKYRITEQ